MILQCKIGMFIDNVSQVIQIIKTFNINIIYDESIEFHLAFIALSIKTVYKISEIPVNSIDPELALLSNIMAKQT